MLRRLAVALTVAVLFPLAGCAPSKANIELRKENQKLQDQVALLQRQREGDLARIRGLEKPATQPTLPQSELDSLFTAQGLSFGKLTGGYRAANATVDEGVVVHVVPTDEDRQAIKAAGSFSITVFDLADPTKPLVASRRFTLEEAKQRWYGMAMLYNYVLKVPFEKQPAHPDLLVHVEFTDALTGRKLTAERSVQVTIPESGAGVR